MSRWVASARHRWWLEGQAGELLRFFRATVDGAGRFVELDDDGRALPTGCPPAPAPQQNLLTVARTVHCYALAGLLGLPGYRAIVDRGLDALWNEHRDPAAGGYFSAMGFDGTPSGGTRSDGTPSGAAGGYGPTVATKAAYAHAFVLLAASSALQAGHAGAGELLDDVVAVLDAHFWSEEEGATRESFGPDWDELEAYRGANSNMHLCEALLAAGDATGRRDLYDRAGRIARRLIDGQARDNGWLLPEHYDRSWTPDYEFNRDRPDDPFRPYGATVGHSLEWSRLVVGVWLATDRPDWCVGASEALFARAVAVGWHDGPGGLAYTVDWDGVPVNDDHYWWPVAEGIAAASTLLEVTGADGYEAWYRRFWEFAGSVLIDHRRGGWYPQFDAANRRKVHPWYGKPDLYHSLQASLIPTLPLAPSVAGAIRLATGE